MGNTIMVRRNKVKVMKIDGDIFRLKTPVTASDATKEYPGFALLDAETVKRLGVRAKPLEPNHILRPNKTYFLVDLPMVDKKNKLPYRRVMSGNIHVGAKERLEMLMLSRRTVSDIGIASSNNGDGPGPGQTRVTLKLPRSQIKKLMGESQDVSEVAAKLISVYLESSGEIQAGDNNGLGRRIKNHYKEKHVRFADEGGRGEIVVLY
ncbi:hypothetical protein CARUB_v10006491mg [Capsella rubella]|uniref:Uncharacterized protein n=1 Tax=Capsella rubella TaxID=81985 RepID=R0H0E4_9BRAS|nr:uncharacterized protein At1g66480 [Capsella rubella]EOA18045.1 hypothetical protein CARUB_v10006491mg [Capsella rubella]